MRLQQGSASPGGFGNGKQFLVNCQLSHVPLGLHGGYILEK